LQQKCAGIDVDQQAIQILLLGMHTPLDDAAHVGFHQPITEEELCVAIQSGKRNKAPGFDGIPTDFYQLMWSDIKADMVNIINAMLSATALHKSFTRGVVVCIPKMLNPMSPKEYRMLTLLNAHIRIFARVLANRIRPWLPDLLHPSQCGGTGNSTILDALAIIRETIATAKHGTEPMCVLSLDFKDAFDRIAHTYMYKVLEHYNFGPFMINNIRKMYEGTNQ
jgi:hypothetical protein